MVGRLQERAGCHSTEGRREGLVGTDWTQAHASRRVEAELAYDMVVGSSTGGGSLRTPRVL